MNDDIDWRGESAELELAELKGQLQVYWNYINGPTMWSFHILQPVRADFLMRFGAHVTK